MRRIERSAGARIRAATPPHIVLYDSVAKQRLSETETVGGKMRNLLRRIKLFLPNLGEKIFNVL